MMSDLDLIIYMCGPHFKLVESYIPFTFQIARELHFKPSLAKILSGLVAVTCGLIHN